MQVKREESSELRERDWLDASGKQDPIDSKQYRLLFKHAIPSLNTTLLKTLEAFVEQKNFTLPDRIVLRGIVEGYVIATDDKAVFDGLMGAEFATILKETYSENGQQLVTITEFPKERRSRMSLQEMFAASITKRVIKFI